MDQEERPHQDATLHCSFCNKSQHDVLKLIAGPTVFICNECVEVCVDVLADGPRFENAHGGSEEPAAVAPQPSRDISSICTFCGKGTTHAMTIAGRGVLCGECANAIEDTLLRGKWLEDKTESES